MTKMLIDRAVVEQALEALYQAREHVTVHTDGPWQRVENDCHVAITALRAALAEPVQEPVQQALVEADRIMGHDDEATEWRERWAHLFGVAGSATSPWRESAVQDCSPGGTGMPATPPQRPAEPVQEPVLVVEKEPDYWSRGHFHQGSKPHIDPTKVWNLPIGTKLYAAPPQRKPLTEEEIRNAISTFKAAEELMGVNHVHVARAIERAHGITGDAA